jgi:hypothetical protein
VEVVVWNIVLAHEMTATARQATEAAVQAIERAADPAAAVAAYASGFATGQGNPKFYEVYVARVVDLGLPEMA